MGILREHSKIGGKISLATALLGVLVILLGLIVDIPHGRPASANTATTSVTVLNTPPTWFVDAQENPASSTSTPTNAGNSVTWTATAQDSSNDNYYLIICKTNATPTANPLAAPTCAGGAGNQWAVSASTASGTPASAATTTFNADPLEFGNWYGWICDAPATAPRCNPEYRRGNGAAASPFVVNHRPTFTVFIDDSPKNPGQVVTWYSTATDQDTYQGTATDTLRLFVCKANDFSITGLDCGPGGSWTATSTATTSNPSASTTFSIPTPDGQFAAYGFVIDSHGNFAASGGAQGTNSVLNINNTAPTIAAASISLLDTDKVGPLVLTGMATQTPGFTVEYTVTDNNSCQTASGTPEITFGLTNVYRSGITQTLCDQSSEYNANNCYPGSVGANTWNVTCTASSTNACLGTGDSDIVWDCTFPLWYIAESTDGTGIATDPPFFAQNWLASVQAADNNFATTSLTESTTGNELNSFLAYNLSTTTIVYGALQPGDTVDPIGPNSNMRVDLQATGNVGLDETLYGGTGGVGTDYMCPTYPNCTGNATSSIPSTSQKYATSSLAYASAVALLPSPGALFAIHVPKSIATSTATSTTNYWGINVPGAITVSGDYTGVNSLIGVTAPSVFW